MKLFFSFVFALLAFTACTKPEKEVMQEKKITMIPPVVASERGRAQTIHVTAWMGLMWISCVGRRLERGRNRCIP